MSKNDMLRAQPTPWTDVVVVCRKCAKKLDGGFGADRKDSLKTALRQALRDVGRRGEVRVFETSCMGICPKRGVTALNASRPGMIHVIPTGLSGTDVAKTLLGDDYGATGVRAEPE